MSLSYSAGRQWARMSWPSRIGAIGAATAFVASLVVAAQFFAVDTRSPTNLAMVVPPSLQASPKPPSKADIEINRILAGARMLKQSMKKPESFELVSATMTDDGSMCYQYRGRNSFNDRRTEYFVISGIDIGGDAGRWNKHCAGKPSTDYSYARSVL